MGVVVKRLAVSSLTAEAHRRQAGRAGLSPPVPITAGGSYDDYLGYHSAEMATA